MPVTIVSPLELTRTASLVWTIGSAKLLATVILTATAPPVSITARPSSTGFFAVCRPRFDRITARTAAGAFVTASDAGARDNASATTLVDPGRYSMLKSYSCRVSDHRCSLPARFGRVISHLRAA
eukprot:jgi/Phyca11/109385/e_gw1.16.785.1